MADHLAGFVPDFIEKEEPREIILQLGKMITNRIPVKLGMQKLTKYDPEYWGLSLLLTDEQAAVALKMVPMAIPAVVINWLLPGGGWLLLILRCALFTVVYVPYAWLVILDDYEKNLARGVLRRLRRS